MKMKRWLAYAQHLFVAVLTTGLMACGGGGGGGGGSSNGGNTTNGTSPYYFGATDPIPLSSTF